MQRVMKTEDLVCATVNSKVRKLVEALSLSVVTSCKAPINLITKPNPVSSHLSRDIIILLLLVLSRFSRNHQARGVYNQ
jgi:hypothetical protein